MLRQALRATLRRGLCTAPPGLRVTLLHNPNCSKSRAALQLLSDYEPKLDLRVREYLRDPLSEAEVRDSPRSSRGTRRPTCCARAPCSTPPTSTASSAPSWTSRRICSAPSSRRTGAP